MKAISPITSRTPPADRVVTRIIYVALLVSIFIYAIIGWVILHNQVPLAPLPQAMQSTVALVIYAVGLITFFAAGPISQRVARNSNARTGFITGLALLESIAIEGLTLGLIGHDFRLFLPMALLSLLGYAQSYPAERLEERIDPTMLV